MLENIHKKKMKMIDENVHIFYIFFLVLQICLAINNRGSGERYI